MSQVYDMCKTCCRSQIIRSLMPYEKAMLTKQFTHLVIPVMFEMDKVISLIRTGLHCKKITVC